MSTCPLFFAPYARGEMKTLLMVSCNYNLHSVLQLKNNFTLPHFQCFYKSVFVNNLTMTLVFYIKLKATNMVPCIISDLGQILNIVTHVIV